MSRKKGIIYDKKKKEKVPSVQEVQGKNMTKSIGDHFAGPLASKVPKSTLETRGESQAIYEYENSGTPQRRGPGYIHNWMDGSATDKLPYALFKQKEAGVVTALPSSRRNGVGNSADQAAAVEKARIDAMGPDERLRYDKKQKWESENSFNNRRIQRDRFNDLLGIGYKKRR